MSLFHATQHWPLTLHEQQRFWLDDANGEGKELNHYTKRVEISYSLMWFLTPTLFHARTVLYKLDVSQLHIKARIFFLSSTWVFGKLYFTCKLYLLMQWRALMLSGNEQRFCAASQTPTVASHYSGFLSDFQITFPFFFTDLKQWLSFKHMRILS